jgi:hypothetical protein
MTLDQVEQGHLGRSRRRHDLLFTQVHPHPRAVWLRKFASDRRHMRGSDGAWLAKPPPWPCAVAEDGSVHTLPELWAVGPEEEELQRGWGAVMGETRFLQFLQSALL